MAGRNSEVNVSANKETKMRILGDEVRMCVPIL